ncbi:DUF4111 domain-containing protein [Salinibacillus aidingensis]|uniref:Spectinomycin 9-adenylyltransferase n=1 Tax=Salinibacillus aidingensis TaxID=237684 RepID=A0ABN1B893_9BACI
MYVQSFLNQFIQIYQTHLQTNLIGIYLHGSLAMGCYQPGKSDIDILIVIHEKISQNKKKKLIQEILQLEKTYPEIKVEMSIIAHNHLQDFKYPTPFELHYSKLHKPLYQENPDYLSENELDPDLAAHLVVTKHRGITLYGASISEIPKVEKRHFTHSLLQDIDKVSMKITEDPVYYSLNLCRTLYYLKENAIASKKEGGEWAISLVSTPYDQLISKALNQYTGQNSGEDFDPNLLKKFAECMVRKINKELNLQQL